MDYFFITGPPRSGTGWLSNYLSYGNVLCTHDSDPIAMRPVYETSGAYAAGNSGSENHVMRDRIDKEFPGAKWVYIVRDSKKSCENIGLPYHEAKPRHGDIEVDFEDLFEASNEIAKIIYPDWECPLWRQDLLKRLNVQTNLDNEVSKYYIPREVVGAMASDIETEAKQEYEKLVSEIFNGNPHVLRFLSQAREMSELFKAISEKKAINVEKAKKAILEIGTEWPNNPILQKHAPVITAAMSHCFERYTNGDIRKYCPVDVDLVGSLAYLAYGAEEASKHMVRVRELASKRFKELCLI